MDLVTGAVIIGLIYGVVVLFEMYFKKEKPPKDYQLKAQIIVLEGKIAQLNSEIEVWKDRGTRAINGRESAEENLNKMHQLFAKMIGNASEVETLKALLMKTEKKP